MRGALKPRYRCVFRACTPTVRGRNETKKSGEHTPGLQPPQTYPHPRRKLCRSLTWCGLCGAWSVPVRVCLYELFKVPGLKAVLVFLSRRASVPVAAPAAVPFLPRRPPGLCLYGYRRRVQCSRGSPVSTTPGQTRLSFRGCFPFRGFSGALPASAFRVSRAACS